MSRDLLLFLEDMTTACSKIVDYSSGRSRDETFSDPMRFDAILMNLHVLGEAVKQLPEDFRERHSNIPWRLIAGMRDFVAHAYFALDLDLLWDTIQNDVPTLAHQIDDVIESESASNDSP